MPGLNKLSGATQMEDLGRFVDACTLKERRSPAEVRKAYNAEEPTRMREIAAAAKLPLQDVTQLFGAVSNFDDLRLWVAQTKKKVPHLQFPDDFVQLTRMRAMDPYADPKYARKPNVAGAAQYQSDLRKKLTRDKVNPGY